MSLAAALLVATLSSSSGEEFESVVAPLLEERCLGCHGAGRARGGLRLDAREEFLRGGDGGAVIVPGDAEGSRLYRAVAGLDPELSMPPSGPRLGAEQLASLRAWIDAGAPWPDQRRLAAVGEREPEHWAFRPIARPAVPALDDPWCRSDLDRFVLAALREHAVEPSPPADPSLLLRRVFLDLTGLPPSPEEVLAFQEDPSDAAFEHVVDTLLASPQYAERWGGHWLDLSRYADSDGYEKDGARPNAWRWRDWVLDSFQRDQPYGEFLRDQLAGDLVPDTPLETRVATGFERNTLTNREGGVDVEQFRVEQVVDRVNTLGAAVLGLTVGCARCHSHKYDPLTQREFYGLFAFFDNADELDVPAPTAAEAEAYARAEATFATERQAALAVREARESALRSSPELAAWLEREAGSGVEWLVPPVRATESRSAAELRIQDDASFLVSGEDPEEDLYTLHLELPAEGVTALELAVLADPSLPREGPGRAENGNFVLSEFELWTDPVRGAGPSDEVAAAERIGFSAATADFSQSRWDVSGAIDGDLSTGWAVMGGDGRARPATALFLCAAPIPTRSVELRLVQHYGRHHQLGRFRVRCTSAPLPRVSRGAEAVAALAIAAAERSEAQELALVQAFGRETDAAWRDADTAYRAVLARAPTAPATRAPVLAERHDRRVTHVHERGDFLRPGEIVAPHTPAFLPPLSADAVPTRLDLAAWLADPEHPLTARVFVNRVWQHLFGEGLVSTPDDFGTRGSPPSHPALLDWLARESQRLGGSRKSLIREIVLSATYRQSSRGRPELWDVDPQNRWLSRQNRFRVEAETVRDLLLAASGTLSRKIGGPSVKPPIPPGVVDVGYDNSVSWETSKGEDAFRRGLYVHRQRTVPYPMLAVFDAPDTLVSCTKRNRSNTPLQALTLRNDPVFLDAARGVARRVTQVASEHRIDRLFLLVLSRSAEPEERAVTEALAADVERDLRGDLAAARAVAGPQAAEDEVVSLAVWTLLARTLFGLEECFTRE